jgi:RNA polymerase sigma-70 factor, ECF subfamily
MTPELADSPPGDAVVIRQSRAEPERFADIFRRYHVEIRGYIARRIGDKTADDVTAEVFLAAFDQRERYDLARDCARPWLYGIATNLIGSYWREEKRQYRLLARGAGDLVTSGEEDVVADRVSAAAARPALLAAVGTLAPGDRDVLLLAALAGLGHQEIAEALDIPYGTVGSRLNRVRRRLRESLGASGLAGDDPPAPAPATRAAAVTAQPSLTSVTAQGATRWTR